MRLFSVLTILLLGIRCYSALFMPDSRPEALTVASTQKMESLNMVTWDEHSLFIHGERLMIMSAEFHPWRLPVPSLWLDIFQKIKAMGLNCVSFYVNWALLEGKPGNFTAEGVFAYEPFFEAATLAGVYLIARPGPYINAEVSFGGYPGWIQRINGRLRTTDPEYLKATEKYIANIGAIIAKAQITNGGPIILYQPENEYTWGVLPLFPDGEYLQYVEDQARKAGIVVPFISNDAAPLGHNAPGTGIGEVDIYGHDAYPLLFDCTNPSSWPIGALAGSYHTLHEVQSPSTPFSILEFQGGAFDPWGGPGFEKCAVLTNHEFERVFYKNNIAAGVKIHNIYMTYGGTNWGNIGHPGGYTSYDYGAAIKEDRTITREKYSELKLQAQWLKASPAYLTARPGLASIWKYSNNAAVTVSRLEGDDTHNGSFFVVRHSDYTSKMSSNYKLQLPTSMGNISVPSLSESLILNGRDSKIVVTDYDVQGVTLLYSTAEIFTHQRYGNDTVLVVYTSLNENNELAVKAENVSNVVADSIFTVRVEAGLVTLAWSSAMNRSIVKIGELYIHVLDRNSLSDYWVPEIDHSTFLIVNGPHLVRSSSVDGGTLSISADFIKPTTVEIIGPLENIDTLLFNGQRVEFHKMNKSLVADVSYQVPTFEIPDLFNLNWSYLDSLPKSTPEYDDSGWTRADMRETNNSYQHLWTPTSLFASDYGFNTGILVFRGHFKAKGTENELRIRTQGGTAYGHSIWLDETFVGSWVGDSSSSTTHKAYGISKLDAGRSYVFTVLVDQMGFDENFIVGVDAGKAPRGIINYELRSPWFTSTPIDWKLTGNFGGENYVDRTRGPLNEGGLFVERQGFHLPKPSTDKFEHRSPLTTFSKPGVSFFTTPLTLSLPSDKYDIPLSFRFGNVTGGAVRIQLYVNGWQFGKFVSNIGPQESFPVPEGILNYNGENWIGLIIWSLESKDTQLSAFTLDAGFPVLTGRSPVELVDSPAWTLRERAY